MWVSREEFDELRNPTVAPFNVVQDIRQRVRYVRRLCNCGCRG